MDEIPWNRNNYADNMGSPLVPPHTNTNTRNTSQNANDDSRHDRWRVHSCSNSVADTEEMIK